MDPCSLRARLSFATFEQLPAHYPIEIGSGVYDIHSPRLPSKGEMVVQFAMAAQQLSPDQIWVNPDCGLKTPGWAEVWPALGLLAVGWGVKQLKVGSFARSERMAKWNEGLRIAEALGPQGDRLRLGDAFPWGRGA